MKIELYNEDSSILKKITVISEDYEIHCNQSNPRFIQFPETKYIELLFDNGDIYRYHGLIVEEKMWPLSIDWHYVLRDPNLLNYKLDMKTKDDIAFFYIGRIKFKLSSIVFSAEPDKNKIPNSKEVTLDNQQENK